MTTALIWAQSENGVIGLDGTMPWRLPEDLAHFKAMTLGAVVIMGRRTWESLPPNGRPLPERTNVVVTRNPDWTADGAITARSVEEAIALSEGRTTWIIGGAQIYDATIADADRLEITEIRGDVEGDTFAPEIGRRWRSIAVTPSVGWFRSRGGLEYRWVSYEATDGVAET